MFLVTTCGRVGEELRTGDVWAEHFGFRGGVLKPETIQRVQNRMLFGIFVKIQFKACLETECVEFVSIKDSFTDLIVRGV